MSRVQTSYKTVSIDGVNIFYREAGSSDAPTLLLLHGFPSSSFMFRDLITELGDRFHLVAPDYPGFGSSDAPDVESFDYTFAHYAELIEKFTDALNLKRYAIYVQDYGTPIGFRLATRRPEAITAIIAQNGNIYADGLTPFWGMLHAWWENPNAETEAPIRGLLNPEAQKHLFMAGVRNPEHISPDAILLNQAGIDRPGNIAVQMALFFDYRTNPPFYPEWHEYLRKQQPPFLAVWGKNDPILKPEGALAYKRDVPTAEIHFLESGHYAIEEDVDAIAGHIRRFMDEKVK